MLLQDIKEYVIPLENLDTENVMKMEAVVDEATREQASIEITIGDLIISSRCDACKIIHDKAKNSLILRYEE